MAGMTRLLAALFALLLLGAAPAPVPARVPIRITLTPVLKAGALDHLDVEIRLTGDADGETRLKLPDEWGGESELWKHVSGFAIQGARVAEDGPTWRILSHAPNRPLVVRYRVNSAYDKDPAVGQESHTYRPVLRPAWFSVLGYAVLPDFDDRGSAPAELRFGPLPQGWKAASSAESLPGRRLNLDEVRQSVNVGGADLRVLRRGPLRIAVIGQWKLDIDGFVDILGRVMQAEQAYWSDKPEPFLVTLTPLTPLANSYSVGGTGMHQAFSIYAGTDSPMAELRWLVAHEYLHNWNPRKLGQLTEGPEQPRDYWFSEGFTDFVAERVLLRSGVWTLEDFAGGLNRALREYGLSPVRTAPNSRIVADFWSDNDVQRLPYDRGFVLALKWDGELRALNGQDLDDVLASQKARSAQAPARLAVDLFPETYRLLGGKDLADDIERHVVKGEAVLLPRDLFGQCATVETLQIASFDRGFDVDATVKNDRVVKGVDQTGPAYAAGLRDGMKLKAKLGGVFGDSTQDYVYEVEDRGQTRTIRYRPAGKGSNTVQEVRLTPGMDASQRAACARSMAGL